MLSGFSTTPTRGALRAATGRWPSCGRCSKSAGERAARRAGPQGLRPPRAEQTADRVADRSGPRNGTAPSSRRANEPWPRPITRRSASERAFLAPVPRPARQGAAALGAIDPDQLLTSEPYRRAARHLAGRTHSPLSDLPSDDDELARAVADLVARAGRSARCQPRAAATCASPARARPPRPSPQPGGRRARAGSTELAREREQSP